MKTRRCPFCGEKIRKIAIFCRYCRHDLPALPPPPKTAIMGWVPVIMAAALIVSSSAFLIAEFLKERRSWLAD